MSSVAGSKIFIVPHNTSPEADEPKAVQLFGVTSIESRAFISLYIKKAMYHP